MITNGALWVDGKFHTPTSIISYVLITDSPKKHLHPRQIHEKWNASAWMKLRADYLQHLEGRNGDWSLRKVLSLCVLAQNDSYTFVSDCTKC